MQISELDKMNRDLEQLEKVKDAFSEMKKELEMNKRSTATWLKMMLSRDITNICVKMMEKQREIAEVEAFYSYRGKHRKEEQHETETV